MLKTDYSELGDHDRKPCTQRVARRPESACEYGTSLKHAHRLHAGGKRSGLSLDFSIKGWVCAGQWRRIAGVVFIGLALAANAQQPDFDAGWTGNWLGTYSYVITPCGITNSGNISLVFSVSNGVVSGTGLEDGVACTDGNCDVTGYGTFSGPLQGTVSGTTITVSGNWFDSCNNQSYGINFEGALSGDAITGTGSDNILLYKLSVTNECLVDWNTVYQQIDGFGASSAFVGGWTPALADMFFSTNTGAGLSLLRSSIGPDGTTQETDIMQMAQARGARVWSSPWSPPADFKDSGTVDGGSFLSTFNQPYAEQLADFVLNMKTNYQVDLYAISVQNEPDFTTTAYQSCGWTAQQIHDFVPYLSQALSNNGVGSTKIMIAESANWDFSLTADAMSDPVTSNMVGILAGHDYNYAWGQVYSGDKPLWETEVSGFASFDGSIADGLFWANYIHSFMTVAQANSFNYWWLVPEGADNQGLTDISGNPAKRMYVFGQFSRFVRPGYYRIGAFNNAGTSISAYKDPGSANFAIVAINPNADSVTQIFNLANFTAGFVTPWITDDTRSLAMQAVIPVTNASFSYALPPQSVVTFVGQTNLNATIAIPPQSQSVYEGDTVAFSVSVSGALPLNYFWLQNGAEIAGATNATCLLTNVPVSDSGSQFSCVVSNVYGAVTSLVATLTVTIPVCVEPPAGIMAWWPGESNAVDIIGGNNGVLTNGVGFTNAKVGTGFAFNGGSNYMQLPENLFPLPDGQPFSIELWFETAAGGVILEHQAGAPFGYPGGGWVPDMYVGTDGNLYVQLFWDGAFDQMSTSTPVNDGNFHHLAVTYDGTNEVGYLDGADIGVKRFQYSGTSYFSCQFGTGYTAGWPAGNGGWFTFNGIIDQPSLYSNALTAAQVQSIYNAGSAGKCMNLPPVIVAQPASQTVVAGGTADFAVSTTGPSGLTYQWIEDATAVANATNAACLLTNGVTPVRLCDRFAPRRLGSATTKCSGDSNEIEPVILVGY